MIPTIRKKNYKVLDQFKDVKALSALVRDTSIEYVAYDTESNGPEPITADIIGFSVSWKFGEGYYVVLRKWNTETQTLDFVFTEEEEHELLAEFYGILVTKKLIMHNAPYDVIISFRNFRIDLTWALYADTIMMKHTNWEEPPHGLKEIAARYAHKIGIPPEEKANQEQLDLKQSIRANGGKVSKKQYDLYKGDWKLVGRYAAADTDLTLRLFAVFDEELKRKGRSRFFYDIEVMPLMRYCTLSMKGRGIMVDVNYFKMLLDEIEAEAKSIEDKINDVLSEEFKIFEKTLIEEAISFSRKSAPFVKAGLEYFCLPIPISKKGTETVAKPALKKLAKNYSSTFLDWVLWTPNEGPEPEIAPETVHAIKTLAYVKKNGESVSFNIRSTDDLSWLIFDYWKLPIDPTKVSKKTGKPSLDKDGLDSYSNQKGISDVLVLRKKEKLISTYILPILSKNVGGWLYPDMLQFGTTSGRYSCGGGLNLQTLPRFERPTRCLKKDCGSKKAVIENASLSQIHIDCPDCGSHFEMFDGACIKRGFIAPPGYKIVNADFSSLEPRIFSAVCGDPGLMEIFQKGLDFYSKIAIDTYKLPHLSAKEGDENFLKKKEPQLRQDTKVFALSVPYGANAYRLAMSSGKSIKEHQDEIDAYLEAYPKLKEYMRNMEREAYTKGKVQTRFGRVRNLPKAKELYDEFGKDIFKKFVMALRFAGPEGEELYEEYEQLKAEAYHPDLESDKFQEERERLLAEANKVKAKIEKLGIEGIMKYSSFRNNMNNAKNSPIQMTAAHVTNAASIKFCKRLLAEDLDAWMCLNVHDEITAIAKDDQAEYVATILKDAMENNWVTKKIEVPILAEPLIASNLADAK